MPMINPAWESLMVIILNAIGIYTAIVIFTRIAGKRSFSKMSSFDFAMTVAIGSLIATTIVVKNVSLVEGAVGIAAIYLIQLIAAYLRRYDIFHNAIDNTPLLLMEGNKIFYENLKKAKVNEDDLRAKLREANVLTPDQVKAVVFETTGDISVLHTSDNTNLDEWLLKEVRR